MVMLNPARQAGPVGRVQLAHRQQVVEIDCRIMACGADSIRDQVWHGEYRRPGFKGESVAAEYASATAGQLFSLDHCDVIPRPVR